MSMSNSAKGNVLKYLDDVLCTTSKTTSTCDYAEIKQLELNYFRTWHVKDIDTE